MKWPTVKLADILLDASSGIWGEPPVENQLGYPILRSTNIHNGALILEDIALRSLSKSQARKYKLQTGDILVTTSSGSPDLIGKNALFKDPGDGLAYLFSNFTQRLRPNISLVIPRFLHLYLNSQRAKSELLRIQSTTSGLRNLNVKLYLSQPISLPSLSEQRRIIEILDQADALRKKRPEADAKAMRIMRTLFINIFGNPDNWASNGKTRPLASLVEVYGGGTPSKQNPDFWEGEIPWVSPKDMKQDILYDSADHISPSAAEQTNLKYINPGTVLIVVRGMILAHTVPIALAGTRLTINQDMKALEPKRANIAPMYLYAALRVSDRRLLFKVRTAAHGTRKIDTEELLQLPILIPSRQDTDRFYRMMGEYNGTVSHIVKTRGMIERLFETLLYNAFSGELTAKWREGHMKELLAEMREQTKYLAPHGTHSQRENVVQQESLF